MSLELVTIYIPTFVSVAAGMFFFTQWMSHDSRVDERINRLRSRHSDREEDLEEEKHLTAFERIMHRFAGLLLISSPSGRQSLSKRCQLAGLEGPNAVSIFVVSRFLLAALPALIMAVLVATWKQHSEMILLCGGIVCGFGLLIPGLVLDWMKSRRQTILLRTLPDFLDVLITCIEGGLSLEGGLKRVSIELKYAHPLLSRELQRMQQEMDFGATPEEATASFATRTDLEAIKTLALFLQQARKLGTSITEALRSHSDMIREKREARAEELAQKAAVKILFPTLALIFPAVFIVLAGPAAIQLAEQFGK